ncbi:MAG: carbamoyl-phosphate synthase small subunit [Patescibacteria group bacterium]
MLGKLILEDDSEFKGQSFGAQTSTAGEVVFSTGMVGYPESLTDPSYLGQILILTYPLIGNYGVPEKKYWESDSIKVSGLIVSNYIDTPSHIQSKQTLSAWLKSEKIPALEITDTRLLTQKIRTKGTMLGKIIVDDPEQSPAPSGAGQNRRVDVNFYDPNKENLVAKVSVKVLTKSSLHNYHTTVRGSYARSIRTGSFNRTVLLIDCGAKKNIERCLIKRGLRVITVPWDFDPFSNVIASDPSSDGERGDLSLQKRLLRRFSPRNDRLGFDAIIISNGPGDPKKADKTIQTIKKAVGKKIPILGVCLGHQLLTLALGGDTRKLKFGHRSQNQPCIMANSNRCFITTQNHGFEVYKIPNGFKPWFANANDGSNEGIIHDKLPIMSVQFHPEANPGPNDTEWIFDYFLNRIRK